MYMASGKDKELPFYRLETSGALKRLGSSPDGLAATEAAARLSQYGPNGLVQTHKEPALYKYFKQYKDLMVILLGACSLVAFLTGDPQTGIVLLLLILFNTVIGFSQEYKAERLMESLERLVVREAKVSRNGLLQQIPSSGLVPGDIVTIEEGDSIPADLRLIDEYELSTNDFALTGESNPSRKFTHAIAAQVELANRHNLVFMGTTVATGHATGVVVATGMRTELGRIASLSADTTTDLSPLQREMNNIAARVTQGTILLCAIVLPLALYFGLPFKNALLFAIGIASSIIPQGLPAEINTALAQAANKLAHARALVKKLSAVETLGATSIICTDKTGTLTKNEMTVEEMLIGRDFYSVGGTGYETNGKIQYEGKPVSATRARDLSLFFTAGALASNARVLPPDDGHSSWYCVGDPTEGALITLATKGGVDLSTVENGSPELREFAFDSARKRMSSLRRFGPQKRLYVFVKGAPESVLERSNELWDHGHVRKIHKDDRTFFLEHNTRWAKSAMRNLGYAYKVLPANTDLQKLTMEEVESDLTFLGMVSMTDPLRDEVVQAMQDAHAANIRVSIITGDFALTAQAIAVKAGLAEKTEDITVVSGEELRSLDDTRVLQLVTSGGVIFSRVSPEDKLRIVDLAKSSELVVAVTGDGINDAPALKRADIGVAMGRTGTDVAKQSAEILLLDDSFNTLVRAIQQGRVIFQNIKKATLSCFTSNAAELVVNLTSLAAFAAFKVPLAMSVMQILAIDMLAELFPLAALGWDQADHQLMQEKPRSVHDHILNPRSILDLLWCGILIGGLAFANFILFFWRHGVPAGGASMNTQFYMKATAMTYLTIVLCQLLNILQRRSENGLFTRYQFHNKPLWIAMAFSLFCVANILYNPVVAPYFGAGPLSFTDWLFALGAAGIFIFIREVQRHANTHHTRDHVLQLLQQQN